jgi:uncharacterized repeat protein (TIGR01451 family)
MKVRERRGASFLGVVLALGAVIASAACSSSSGNPPPPDDASSEGSSLDSGSPSTGDAAGDVIADATNDATATSEAGACPSGQTSCSGVCVATRTDPGNCGSCGNACTGGHVCSNGQCSLTCGGGTTQCGSACIDTNVDPNNCGGCGHACATGQLCSAGQCATQCGGGLSTCPGAGGDGGGTPLCVDEQTDPDHCGGCSNVCPSGNACGAGKCSVACPGAEVNCNGLCINPSNDDQYCGATGACGAGSAGSAGTQCPAGEVCNAGSCSVSCPGNEINCSGRCIDPSSDQHHCGATAGCGANDAGGAGAQCPSGQVCASGQCSVSCPGSEINCNGACVDPTTNNQHCGATAGCGTGGSGTTGTNCSTLGEVCTSTGCQVTCPASEVNCGGSCIDPKTSTLYCGAAPGCGVGGAGGAGQTCATGAACNGATCQCPGSQKVCGAAPGVCSDTSTDPQNCGTCAHVCGVPNNASAACGGGTCGQVCHPGFLDCDGNPANGCEINGQTDANNCGTCGHQCPALCASGTCVGIGDADLQLQMIAPPSKVNVGSEFSITYVLTNNGPAQATGVAIQAQFPPGATFLSANSSQGSFLVGPEIWTVGTLNSGSSATLDCQFTLVSPNQQTFLGTVAQADQVDPIQSNNAAAATVLAQVADLAIGVTPLPAPNVGDTIAPTFTLTDNFGSDPATSVLVTVTVPAGVTFVMQSSSQGTFDSSTGIWNVGTLAPGSAATLQVFTRVVSPNPFSFVATISHADQFDPIPSNNTVVASLTPQQADLVAGASTQPTVTSGSMFTVQYTVGNNGPDSATNVSLTVLTNGAAVSVDNSTPSQGNFDSTTGVWTVGTVAAGQTPAPTLDVLYTENASTTSQSFTVTVTQSDQFDPSPSNNTSTATITVQ